MKDALTILLILLVVVLVVYWFGINTQWQTRIRNRLYARKIMRALKKRMTRILGGLPTMCKDGKHVKLGKRIFTQEEYEQYYRERMIANGYKETEDGWEKEQE